MSTSNKQNGSGVTIAIVDAYDSPTLLSDAQTYFRINDPNHPLAVLAVHEHLAAHRRSGGHVWREWLV